MRKLTKNRAGFTLTEVLIAVAVLVVLLSIAAVGLVNIQKSVRYKEMDGKAEILYAAAQNSMTRLRTSGYAEKYAATAPGVCAAVAEDGRQSYYVEKTAAAAADILPAGVVDAELYGQCWAIEFDPASGSVTAVFYWEDAGVGFSTLPADSLRDTKYRHSYETPVGYYGGEAVKINRTGALAPWVEVKNGEKLAVTFCCEAAGDQGLTFDISLSDGTNTKEMTVTPEKDVIDNIYRHTLTLDELDSESGRFAERFPDLRPGAALTVRLTAKSGDPLVADGEAAPAAVNSLFADDSTADTAAIRCCRHLQNLDRGSGVTDDIKNAVLKNALDWRAACGDAVFTPIGNEHLQGFDGGGNLITGLNAAGENAGLFGVFFGSELKNIRLVALRAAAAGAAGGLAGKTTGNLTVENCRVYLRSADVRGKTLETMPYTISGPITGGLVGAAARGSLTIKNSFAAAVVTTGDAAGTAGGLVGSAGCDVNIVRAYADCYLTGNACGGLVGGVEDGAGVTLNNCYAAGYLDGKGIGAGLVEGPVFAVKNCYTAVHYSGTPAYLYTTMRGLSDSENSGSICYMCNGLPAGAQSLPITQAVTFDTLNVQGKTDDAVTALLGNAFSAASGTVAYNLLSQGLTAYSYPALSGLPHYGDWQAEFAAGALVYYEKYADGGYGFFGGNVPNAPLHDGAVTGDGYALLYRDAPPTESVNITYQIADGTGVDATLTPVAEPENYHTLTHGGDTYYLLPLPAEAVNTAYAPAEFYQKLRVDGTDYWYNPHFAKAVGGSGTLPKLEAGDGIAIRSPRNLYNLSRYYGSYAAATADCIFEQETDIRYGDYDWENFCDADSVSVQTPIGSGTLPFAGEYDGNFHRITGVSFVAGDDGYLGMFGRSVGTLRGIALVAEPEAESPGFVGGQNQAAGSDSAPQYFLLYSGTGYVGALAGRSEGSISDCFAADYHIRVSAYRGTEAYVGGLVGENTGSIRSSAAESPEIAVSNTFASVWVGGFAGSNSGLISGAYTVDSIHAVLPDLQHTDHSYAGISGFLAKNTGGTVRDCYCASAFDLSGRAVVNGFGPAEGTVTNSFYLCGGSYAYAGAIRAYDSAFSGAARGISYQNLRGMFYDGTILKKRNTPAEPGAGYPFPTIVAASAAGDRVHYGGWPLDAELGELGVFYWENEVGGNNPGCHFSFLGTKGDADVSGSTLCQAHDDGGVITDYGYGFYTLDGSEDKLRYNWSDELETSAGKGNNGLVDAETGENGNETGEVNIYNTEVSAAIGEQMPGYKFYAYTTRVPPEGDAPAGDYLYIADDNARNGTLTLTYHELPYVYTVSPFFADAMSLDSKPGADPGKDAVSTGAAVPGSEMNPYEIRTAAQLQYINWNGEAKNTSTLVTSGNCKKFPYLQYTTVNGTGKQKKSDAERNRPRQFWMQTHDIGAAEDTQFYPIAGAVVDSAGYNVTLRNWFGGVFDGQSYYIKNIAIKSCCYNVGLFGTTAGAEISNVILYSDRDSEIQRATRPTPATGAKAYDQYQCAYALGGFVGIAYDYQNEQDAQAAGEITNCAIAGYRIIDNSQNQQGLGEANIGGLIGVANVNLNRCSAVVDIAVNCTHYDADKKLKAAAYGNFVRVGGLTGGARFDITDCYTGGSITVSEDAYTEILYRSKDDEDDVRDGTIAVPGSSGPAHDIYSGYKPENGAATYIFVGGIGGSGFSSNFTNFNGGGNTMDGKPRYRNCYTCISLPKMTGGIYAVSIIGSVADRYGRATAALEMDNCYYLDTVADIKYDLPNYFAPRKKSIAETLTEETKAKMLQGDLSYLTKVLWDNGKPTVTVNGLTAVDYDALSSLTAGLNAGRRSGSDAPWAGVTTFEQSTGMNINGKYSFPGNNPDLKGLNYPFPAVVTQTDPLTGEKVWVHYGEWVRKGLYWEEGLARLDLIADYEAEARAAEREFTLRYMGAAPGSTPSLQFTYGGRPDAPDFAEVITTGDKAPRYDAENKCWRVTVRALRPGAVDIAATDGAYQAAVTLLVSAELNISVAPAALDVLTGAAPEENPNALVKTAVLRVTDKAGKPVSVTWDLPAADDGDLLVAEIDAEDGADTLSVRGLRAGETVLHLCCRFDYSIGDGTATIPVTATAVVPVTAARQAAVGLRGTARTKNGEEGAPVDASFYCESILAASESAETARSGVQVSYVYPKGTELLALPSLPVLPAQAGSWLYVYGTVDGALPEDGIDTISLRLGDESESHRVYGTGADTNYTAAAVTVGARVGNYVPIQVVSDSEETAEVTVTLVSAGVTYTLTAPVVCAHEVRFFDEKTLLEGQTQTVEHGGAVVWPADPAKDGFVFAGWWQGETKVYPAGDPALPAMTVTRSMEFTAHWREAAQEGESQ